MQELQIGRCHITTTQLYEANAESIRLGFSRNLHLPDDLPELKFPIMNAYRHEASDEKLENVRLVIFFATDTQHASDWQPIFLDVTPDWLAVIRTQTRELAL